MGESGQARTGSPGQQGQAGPSGPEYLSGKLARQVQADLDEYMTNNPDFPVSYHLPHTEYRDVQADRPQTASGRPKAVLFVVDRSMDPVAPLLHEFWYQAMVNDLLKIDDGVRYK